MVLLVSLLVTLASTVATSLAYSKEANEFTDPDLIEQRAKAFLTQLAQNTYANDKTEVKVAALDKRLRLAACRQPLSAAIQGRQDVSKRMLLKISCEDTGGWSIFVSGNIDVWRPLVYARQPLTRNTPIDANDLEIKQVKQSALMATGYRSIDDVIGMIPKRNLAVGTMLSNFQLAPPKVIKRGENVSIVAKSATMQVRMSGKALSDGEMGELILVQNSSSKRSVQARVVGPGIVEVNM